MSAVRHGKNFRVLSSGPRAMGGSGNDARYKAILDAAEDAVFLHEPSSMRILDTNRKACEMFGYTRDQICKLDISALSSGVPPYDGERLLETIRSNKQLDSYTIEWRSRAFSGRVFWTEMTLKKVEIEGSHLLLSWVRDISARRQAEESLLASEEKWRNILAYSPDAIAVLALDGTIAECNQPALDMLKFDSRDRIIGSPCMSHMSPQDRGRAEENTQKTLRDGYTRDVEYTMLRSDGSAFPVEVSASVVGDATGEPIGYVVVFRDISTRKQWQEELRQSEERYRLLAEHAQDIIYRYDRVNGSAGHFISPSCQSILGYPAEELCQRIQISAQRIHQDDYGQLRQLGRQSPNDAWVTFRWLHPDGRTVWLEMHNRTIRDAQGNPVAYEGIVRNITERKQLEEKLLRAQRLEAAGRMASQVAHDFNNLLSPMVAYPKLIKADLPVDHPAVEYCDDLEEAALQMAAINKDMMALGSRPKPERRPVDVNRLVEQVIERSAISMQKLSVDLRLNPKLLPAAGSAPQLLRVFTNLVSNARESMRDVGSLSIETDNVYIDSPVGRYDRVEIGEYVRITVSDSGCGIPEEIRDKVFDAFFTTKTMSERRGCGLGLSVVHAIVQDHNGYLDMETEVDRGTTFSVYLPVCREAEEVHTSKPIQGGTESILVVDDDRLQRGLYREALRRLGYQVQLAASGEEAVERISQEPFDLLILDMIMGSGMDGTSTYKQAAELRPGQKAILISGFAASDRVAEAQALGAGPFVPKPLTIEQLGAAVRKEIER